VDLPRKGELHSTTIAGSGQFFNWSGLVKQLSEREKPVTSLTVAGRERRKIEI